MGMGITISRLTTNSSDNSNGAASEPTDHVMLGHIPNLFQQRPCRAPSRQRPYIQTKARDTQRDGSSPTAGEPQEEGKDCASCGVRDPIRSLLEAHISRAAECI